MTTTIECPCCTCANSGGPEGCAGLWVTTKVMSEWEKLPDESTPKRIQRWLNSWDHRKDFSDHGSDHICPPKDIDPCPGHIQRTNKSPCWWTVWIDDVRQPHTVYGPSKKEVIKIVHGVEGPNIKVRVVQA